MDNRTPINLQTVLLNTVRKDRMPVTIYLTNGFQIRGVITGYDNNVIIVKSNETQEMIYKHAISTIVPQSPVEIITQ
ncbi:RNA chaperone Hfq [Agathobaculum sp. NTUH-O15-33]|uniref:RNA chaperone Hfq n=1 Tax=Agathobaculum sp. NTUH-O15-33 TaxID=3079302 RepID=UPI00295851BF|nr:RNA chaperone Hfq [Agathobaculum sp. NTUH-O15-33]WNX84401.1 RNA chaperone Hfq [Agathobaculum sp. NTUH-O15-33]